jgi:N-acetylglucosamine kinase-like BadF-type ATPase
MYYIGIDAGSSYARLVAVDENMKVVGRHAGAFKNRDSLSKLLLEFNRMTNTVLNDCKALCLGGSSMDDEAKRNEMKNQIDDMNLKFPVKLTTEPQLMISAQTRGGPGVVVYCGMSAWGAASDESGAFYTCGGYGNLVPDAASGYYIGMQAIAAALASNDLRTEKTSLVKSVTDHFKINDISEIKKIIYGKDFNENTVAELALAVKYASSAGDNAALEIESQAAISLSQIANALIKKSGLNQPTVCMAGSVLLTNDNIQKLFSQLVTSKNKYASIVPLREKLEMGALYLAMGMVKDK